MAPSCGQGLSRVGFPSDLGVATNIPSPWNLIRNLTAGSDVVPNQQGSTSAGRGAVINGDVTVCLPKVEVRSSPGRGLGLFAVDRIPAYTRVLEDYALLSLASGEDIPELWQKYSVLPGDERQQFDELAYSSNQASKEDGLIARLKDRGFRDEEARKMVRVSSRFMANAFKEDDDRWRATVFLTVARINHSCTPNAQPHYRPSSGAKMIYSFRDIEPGEEIEISYFGVIMPYTDRQARAKSWGFTCNCPACSLSGNVRGEAYETAISQIRDAMNLSSQNTGSLIPGPKLIKATQNAINVAKDPKYPWLAAALPSLHVLLATGQCQERRLGEELAAWEGALEWESKVTGADSHFSLQHQREVQRVKDISIGD